ncbi:MAG: SapC family protein [Polaromonas sp.]|nr:SapC family protein [Polaromonas sp.]
MSNVLFYSKPVAINRDQHRVTKIGPVSNFLFAAKTNSVALTGIEFTEACKEYPIVFAKVGERKVPVALLGLRDDENLYIDADGKWEDCYIPAFVRRYPFVLAEAAGDQFVVCIDESSTAFNATDGQLLFDEKGANTPFLDGALNFLNAYQAQMKRTELFVNQLEELGLFTEMSAKTELTDGRKFLFNGLYVLDEQKWQALKDKKAAEFVKSGEAALVYAHLLSLSNMSHLVDRVSKRA